MYDRFFLLNFVVLEINRKEVACLKLISFTASSSPAYLTKPGDSDSVFQTSVNYC